MERGQIVKIRFLSLCKRFGLLALIALAFSHPVQAASQPAGVATAAPQVPILLAWDRVGSPIQIRA